MDELSGNGYRRRSFWERISSFLRGFGFRGDRKDAVILLRGAVILLVLAEVFYDSPAAALLMIPLMRPICAGSRRREEEKRRQELVYEFKECMAAVLTAMKAGSSAENAFRNAMDEMVFSYGSDSAICAEMALLIRGLDSNIPLERLLSEFAVRSDAEEIRDFADVFSIAKRSGGNMTEIMSRTISQIQNRIDVEREIRVVMSSSRLEQQIMNVVPIGIIAYMRMTSGGFMDVLYESTGILIMTVCLLVYGAAYMMSEKIVEIHI